MLLRIILTGRVLTALTMLIIFLSMTLIGLGFSEAARLMPLMIGIPGTILGLVQFIMEFRVARSELSIVPFLYVFQLYTPTLITINEIIKT